MLCIFAFIVLLILGLVFLAFLIFNPTYYKGKISNHFNGKVFFNPGTSYKKPSFAFLKWQFSRNSIPWPEKLINKYYDIPPKKVFGDGLRVSNVGHATFLIQTVGLNILTDPVWSERVSPVSFAGPKRVINPGIKFENLPPIDIIWISHNHYDHLDLQTIERLWNVYHPRIITPLGNDTIIKAYNSNIQVEAYDLEDTIEINKKVRLYLGPMQHWSARGLFDRNKSLWATINIETPAGNIYFVGDSGYGNGNYFKLAKEKFSSFRLALLPMGAYEPRWFMKYAHMDPEEFVKAHIDLGMPVTIPSHYDVFKLTDEGHGEALLRLAEAKEKLKVGDNIKVIRVGQFFEEIK